MNNIQQISIGAQIYTSADGNVIRVSVFENSQEYHIELYKPQALQLLKRLQANIDLLPSEPETQAVLQPA